jgi:uncharacterized membrane protein
MRARRTTHNRRGERGSILIMSAVGLIVALISTSLAIDLGFLAHEIRVDQKVADLAALDAVRALPADPTSAAQASALRNGFPYTNAGYNLAVKWSDSKAGPWSTDPLKLPTASVVQVAATSPHTNFFPFVAGGQTKTRTAVAGNQPEAAFSVGSTLASVDTQKSFLDPVLGSMLGGATALNMTAVSYSGLAGGNVSLSALQTQLVSAYPAVGTPTGLLNTSIKVSDLFTATAQALTLQGATAAAAAVNNIPIASISNTATVKLGQLVSLSQPGNDSALSTTLNVFQLVTGAADVANGTNFVSIPGINVNLPGVATVGFKLSVIEPPQVARGPVGTVASTSQVKLRLVISILSLALPVNLDLDFRAGSATGTLTAIDCSSSPSITISATTTGATVSGTGAALGALGGTLTATGSLAAATASAVPPFAYPSQFQPPVGTTAFSRSVGAASALNLSAATVSVTGSGGILAGTVAAGVQTLLPTILTAVDVAAPLALQPLLKVMGLDVAGADISALGIYPPPPACGGATLLK